MTAVHLDETVYHIDGDSESKVIFSWNDVSHVWQRVSTVKTPAPTRMQTILSTRGPLVLVVSSDDSVNSLLAASRVAFLLHVYHRLDTEVIRETEALEREQQGSWSEGNMVFIGPPGSKFVEMMINRELTPVGLVNEHITVGGVPFSDPEHGLLFLHPHPQFEHATMLFIVYNSARALERALRLFPYRTGVPVPSWIVVSDDMDRFGMGGVKGAGVWGTSWSLNERLAWLDV